MREVESRRVILLVKARLDRFHQAPCLFFPWPSFIHFCLFSRLLNCVIHVSWINFFPKAFIRWHYCFSVRFQPLIWFLWWFVYFLNTIFDSRINWDPFLWLCNGNLLIRLLSSLEWFFKGFIVSLFVFPDYHLFGWHGDLVTIIDFLHWLERSLLHIFRETLDWLLWFKLELFCTCFISETLCIRGTSKSKTINLDRILLKICICYFICHFVTFEFELQSFKMIYWICVHYFIFYQLLYIMLSHDLLCKKARVPVTHLYFVVTLFKWLLFKWLLSLACLVL